MILILDVQRGAGSPGSGKPPVSSTRSSHRDSMSAKATLRMSVACVTSGSSSTPPTKKSAGGGWTGSGACRLPRNGAKKLDRAKAFFDSSEYTDEDTTRRWPMGPVASSARAPTSAE